MTDENTKKTNGLTPEEELERERDEEAYFAAFGDDLLVVEERK